MSDVKRVKVYPTVDGTESYIKSAIFQQLLLDARVELIKSRKECFDLKKSVGRLVGSKVKSQSDRVGSVLPMKRRDRDMDAAPRGRRKQSEDIMDQGEDNLVSLEEVDRDGPDW